VKPLIDNLFKCEFCLKSFNREKKRLKDSNRFCNQKCFNLFKRKSIICLCKQCNQPIQLKLSQQRKSKSGNHFCSRNCSASYNNTHKTSGTKRSKLEKWIEDQLNIQLPNLNILYNKKDTINSELDIYIPSLSLAFELNGIFHYEPIYGSDKLSAIKNNDDRKFQACLEQQIELVIIDSSEMKNFKPLKAQKYLNIINQIINLKHGGN